MAQGMSFISDMKLGHYMKIPPRLMFTAQSAATLIAAIVQIFVQDWLFHNIDGICNHDQTKSEPRSTPRPLMNLHAKHLPHTYAHNATPSTSLVVPLHPNLRRRLGHLGRDRSRPHLRPRRDVPPPELVLARWGCGARAVLFDGEEVSTERVEVCQLAGDI